ncbi:MAG TPA: autotransporter domain-containing protein, partial [Ktedonobacterales bacterium]|nr:autotransporter domain-containing protein [Ktedonobacterales bacterium]
GTGAVGATTIAAGSTLAPGGDHAVGTLTVNGNLAFQSGALYLVQVNPTSASSTNVAGTASLTGGSVQAVFAPGSYVTNSYDILHAAGGLGGTKFTGVSGNVPAGFTQGLSYSTSGTDVSLNLTAVLGAPGPGGPGGPGTGGLNQSQQHIANALNNFFNNGGALPPNFVNVFGLTGANLANTLSLLSGEAATGAQRGAFQLGGQFLGLMLDPFVAGRSGPGGAGGPALGFAPERAGLPDDIALAYANVTKAPPAIFEQRWTAWGGAFGGTNRTSGDPLVVGSHDLSAQAGGVAAGLDYHVSRDIVVGAAIAGGATNWGLAQGLGGGKSDALQAGVYAAARSGAAYVAASLAFANHWMSTDRTSAFGDHLGASFNAESFGGRVEGGYRFATAVGGITPYGALQAQSFHTPTYSETDFAAGGFGLSYNSRTASDTRGELGTRFDHAAWVDPGAELTLRGRLAWAHDWISDPTLTAVFQALPGASFVVNGATPVRDSALASAGAELRLANGVTLLGQFDGEFAGRSETYTGTGTLRVNW